MSLNLWSLQYVLEVAKTGSISRAAQNLFLSQPHLSNTIKSVETELGLPLFQRSAKGMVLTGEGTLFVERAEKILGKVSELELLFHVQPHSSLRLNVSVTRSYQVNRCITEYIKQNAEKEQLLLRVKETNPFQVLEDVRTKQAELGILHFFDAQQDYFLNCFKMFSLRYEKGYERKFLLAMSKDNPLAHAEPVYKAMLREQVAIIYGDYETPVASYETVTQVSDIVLSHKRIYVYDRAAAMETLGGCPNAYMWITGLHPDTLQQYGVVLKRCEDVHAYNYGYNISKATEPLTRPAQDLLEMIQKINWSEQIDSNSL